MAEGIEDDLARWRTYACAALTGLMASADHHDFADDHYRNRWCRRAGEVADVMVELELVKMAEWNRAETGDSRVR